MPENDEKKESENLEKELEKKLDVIVPIVEQATQKILGVTIDELNKDIGEKLTKPQFNINTEIPFKRAKKLFRKEYLKKILQTKYGNISEAAKIAGTDRRSVHRIIKETGLNVAKIRNDMLKPSYVKEIMVTDIIGDVLKNYENVIHPEKLNQMYKNVTELSKDIVKELHEEQLPLDEAEKEWEKAYIKKALEESIYNVAIAAKRIGLRYETLHRKVKKLGLA
ncbi:hypothetical protein JW968_05935 [Candidatus Woesearchaeota archaeon]|nr:hypothetical protein [Candidatus Woesearchaeota archaeon]